MKMSATLKILAALVAAFPVIALAHNGKEHADHAAIGSFIKASDAGVSTEWLAKARAEYPLDTCPVSGDKLEGGDMGSPQDYVYHQEGKGDRLVRLCCHDCVKDFKEDPAKYLKTLADAADAKTKASSPGAKTKN